MLNLMLLLATVASAANAATPTLPYTVPGRMIHDRFYVEAQAATGKTLYLVTDTGGGTNLSTLGADKLGLEYTVPADRYRQAAGRTRWPTFAGPWIPEPGLDDDGMPILVAPAGINFDGMLGAAWFADRTWEWDYRAGTLRLMPDGALPEPGTPSHVVKLGFQRDADGKHATDLPSVSARIDGQVLYFLFNTGASFRLNDAAATMLGDRNVLERSGSFITSTVLQGWRERHPDWKYIESGNGTSAMILVPDIEIAGFHTGPVWFAERPDRSFHEFMAQWTDRKLDGALGGNALRTFRITADYTAGTAVFER